jgi:hypothetical protein
MIFFVDLGSSVPFAFDVPPDLRGRRDRRTESTFGIALPKREIGEAAFAFSSLMSGGLLRVHD